MNNTRSTMVSTGRKMSPFFGTAVETVKDMALAKQAGDLLEKTYPGHAWMVSIEQGIMNIWTLRLSHQWGYRILVDDLDGDPTLRKVVMAGGECLERYNIKRAEFDRGDHLRKVMRPELTGRETGPHIKKVVV